MPTQTKISPGSVELRLVVVSDHDLSESDFASLALSYEMQLNETGKISITLSNNREVFIHPRFHFHGQLRQVVS